MRGYGGRKKGIAIFIGTSITLATRSGITLADAMPYLVCTAKSYFASGSNGLGIFGNAGLSSDTSAGMLARLERDCLAYGPSMIAIEAGINDPGASIAVGAIGTAGSYTDNMSQMIVKAQRTGARVTLWIPTLVQNATLDGQVAPYRTAARTLAGTYGCDTFDSYSDMAALSAGTQNSYFYEAAGSGEHFSVAGLLWLASLVGSGSYANSFLSA